MSAEKVSAIMRFEDGSIDYRYYAERGMMARNRELKAVTEKLLGASRLKTHAFPTLFTVVLLVLIF
jgi:hypothetical protein